MNKDFMALSIVVIVLLSIIGGILLLRNAELTRNLEKEKPVPMVVIDRIDLNTGRATSRSYDACDYEKQYGVCNYECCCCPAKEIKIYKKIIERIIYTPFGY